MATASLQISPAAASLAAALGIAPGPRLGELLEAIAEARYTGEIETAAQAIEYARAYEPDTD